MGVTRAQMQQTTCNLQAEQGLGLPREKGKSYGSPAQPW